MTKNEIKSEHDLTTRGIRVYVRGDENYVREHTARLLNDMSLKWGYGIICTTKPKIDETRKDGSWVSIMRHAQSCD